MRWMRYVANIKLSAMIENVVKWELWWESWCMQNGIAVSYSKIQGMWKQWYVAHNMLHNGNTPIHEGNVRMWSMWYVLM